MGKRPRWYLWALARAWKLSYIKPTVPFIGRVVLNTRLGLTTPDKFNISYLPVNASVELSNIPLPVIILEDIIRQSPHRTIIRRCTCREAKHCQNYDMNIGCLHIGLATADEDSTVARHVSAEEALSHLHKAIATGLIPFMGHAAGDNLIWNVAKDKPFLTVCFCCPCCCTLMNGYKYLPVEARTSFHRLGGLSVSLDQDKCIGCGKCSQECFTHAISIGEGKAVHNDMLCKACGHCTTTCPQSAFAIQVDDLGTTINELYNRLDSEVGGLPINIP